VVATICVLLLVIARVFFDLAVTSNNKGEMPMKNKATNDVTETAQRANKRPILKPVLDAIWGLCLGVDANFITGLEAA
jgi:hypothetical protein